MPDDPASPSTLPPAHANRHAWALEKYGYLLTEALRKDTSTDARKVEKLHEGQIPAHLVSLILEKADPTQNKGMTAWLVAQYAQGSLRLEDLGTANETLTMFQRYAQRLEIGQRDLGQYPSLAAVWEAVIAFANAEEQQISGKAQKALDRDKAYAESCILRQDRDGFTIAVPLTEFAAKWWGRGTRWCTAAEKDNAFGSYHRRAPLMVFNIPKLKTHGKFQLWVTDEQIEFMDAADAPVSVKTIEKYWSLFSSVLHYAVSKNSEALQFFPQKFRTADLCKMVVEKSGDALSWVPTHLLTPELCRIAVRQNGLNLRHVPPELQTAALYDVALRNDGRALAYVPLDQRDRRLCQVAVAQTGDALRSVPPSLRTASLCKRALITSGDALEFVPESMRTRALCKIAVAKKAFALLYVPKSRVTEEIAEAAVRQNGFALQLIPAELITEDMCKIAVQQRSDSLQWVPGSLVTSEMCNASVRQRGWNLRFVPRSLKTLDICKVAVSQDRSAIAHVPPEMCSAVISSVPPSQMEEMIPLDPLWSESLLDDLASALHADSSSQIDVSRHV
jgi:hypothetical protein